jgi:hypothetical protein
VVRRLACRLPWPVLVYDVTQINTHGQTILQHLCAKLQQLSVPSVTRLVSMMSCSLNSMHDCGPDLDAAEMISSYGGTTAVHINLNKQILWQVAAVSKRLLGSLVMIEHHDLACQLSHLPWEPRRPCVV